MEGLDRSYARPAAIKEKLAFKFSRHLLTGRDDHENKTVNRLPCKFIQRAASGHRHKLVDSLNFWYQKYHRLFQNTKYLSPITYKRFSRFIIFEIQQGPEVGFTECSNIQSFF